MYIPFLSSPRSQSRRSTTWSDDAAASGHKLSKRQRGGGGRGGGGGGGRVSSGGGGGGGGGGRANSASSASKPPPYSPGAPPPPYSVGGGRTVRGNTGQAGGGTPYTIGAGNAFAGRSAGGGTRGQVYGSRGYGGYGFLPFFPFMFWPLFFTPYPYYYASNQFGPANNDSRPGGDLQAFTLLPASETTNGAAPPSGNAFALYGDANSVADLVPILAQNCSTSTAYGANYTADPFNAVQYYRGDSFVLLLDGYNNSLPFINADQPDESFTVPQVPPAPLPGTVNQTYLDCVNATVGAYVGLIDSDYASESAASHTLASSGGLAGAAALLAVLFHLF